VVLAVTDRRLLVQPLSRRGDPDGELIEKVDAVTGEQVAELAREFYEPAALSAAAIAPNEDRFRAALAPVNEALAAV
jgi:hypothetical protein